MVLVSQVVLSAVQSEGCRLQHATERLKELFFCSARTLVVADDVTSATCEDDRSLVLAAVSSDGAALAFASKRLHLGTCSTK